MIYLASTSPRRKKLLKETRKRFRVIPPIYDESSRFWPSPSRTVREHALGKALSVAPRVKNGIIISADTLVHCRGRVLGKPKNMRDAFRLLSFLSGRWHTVYTGVAVFRVRSGAVVRKKVFVKKTRIHIRPLTHAQIISYFKTVNPLDKAGAYALQSKSGSIVSEVRGSLTNAIGLPMESLGRL